METQTRTDANGNLVSVVWADGEQVWVTVEIDADLHVVDVSSDAAGLIGSLEPEAAERLGNALIEAAAAAQALAAKQALDS